ncbi:hypothetical protein ABLE92_10740 [Gordonia sp. VNQ95]|uniref:hypothetical protein n=1 Tax=Gordonia TaxID=2053 RepID=UPI0032B484B4
MNPSVALIITAACALAAVASVLGVTGVAHLRWRPTVTTIVAVAVTAWIAGGMFLWLIGNQLPARPGVFAGYAATALGLAAVAVPATGHLGPRSASLVRAVVLALLAFVCWRTESVWLTAVPGV